MEQTQHPQQPYGASTTSTNGGTTHGVRDALNAGRQGIAAAADDAKEAAASDLESLRRDLNSLKDTVAKFVSQASGEAAGSVREASSTLAKQVGEAASQTGSRIVTAVGGQAKTFASELEEMGRRNPLGSMGAAVAVGVLIGLWSRARH
jgi:ElaB/YqjD/DUF883 family membrane-anchored ribosome-binding protein